MGGKKGAGLGTLLSILVWPVAHSALGDHLHPDTSDLRISPWLGAIESWLTASFTLDHSPLAKVSALPIRPLMRSVQIKKSGSRCLQGGYISSRQVIMRVARSITATTLGESRIRSAHELVLGRHPGLVDECDWLSPPEKSAPATASALVSGV